VVILVDSAESLQSQQVADALTELALREANVLARAGEYSEAERIIAALPDEQRATATALDLLARIQAQQGRFAEAEAFWQRVLELEPGSAAARRALERCARMRRTGGGFLPYRFTLGLRMAIVVAVVVLCVVLVSDAHRRGSEADLAVSRGHRRIEETRPAQPVNGPEAEGNTPVPRRSRFSQIRRSVLEFHSTCRAAARWLIVRGAQLALEAQARDAVLSVDLNIPGLHVTREKDELIVQLDPRFFERPRMYVKMPGREGVTESGKDQVRDRSEHRRLARALDQLAEHLRPHAEDCHIVVETYRGAVLIPRDPRSGGDFERGRRAGTVAYLMARHGFLHVSIRVREREGDSSPAAARTEDAQRDSQDVIIRIRPRFARPPQR
jgi:tetratricopeptide (TPR) repeat protein